MNDFLPRGSCAGWTTGMIVAIDIADAFLWLAYYVLPALMYLFSVQIKFRELKFPRSLILWYVAFILACGTTHAIDVLMTWIPAWHIDVVIHCLAAGISIAALIAALLAIRGVSGQKAP